MTETKPSNPKPNAGDVIRRLERHFRAPVQDDVKWTVRQLTLGDITLEEWRLLSAEMVRLRAVEGAYSSGETPPIQPATFADAIVQRVADMDDRTSPDDWPEAMLITGAELRAFIVGEFERFAETTREQQWNDDKLIDWLVKRSGYSEGEAFAIVTRMQPPGSCSACGELGPCNCGAKKGGETGA